MTKETIVYLDPVTTETQKIILSLCPQQFNIAFARPGGVLDADVFKGNVEYLLTAVGLVDSELLSSFNNLKLIQKTGVGTENIDKEAAAALKIPVATTPGANSTAVAELVILYILALYRKLIELDQATKAGQWLMWEKRLQSFELKGKEIGLIGFGNIGRAINQRLKSFGARISYYDIKPLNPEEEKALGVRYKPLKEIISESDVISLHLPLTAETKHLIDEEELNSVKENCILINTARGPVVNEDALVKALNSGKLAGAALDTYACEPVNPDHPLLKCNNIITTPHIGAGTIDTWKNVLQCAFANIERVSLGEEALHVVN